MKCHYPQVIDRLADLIEHTNEPMMSQHFERHVSDAEKRRLRELRERFDALPQEEQISLALARLAMKLLDGSKLFEEIDAYRRALGVEEREEILQLHQERCAIRF